MRTLFAVDEDDEDVIFELSAELVEDGLEPSPLTDRDDAEFGVGKTTSGWALHEAKKTQQLTIAKKFEKVIKEV